MTFNLLLKEFMPELYITLVDHTQKSESKLNLLILRHLEEIFLDLLDVPGEVSAVSVRWAQAPVAGEQDLVLHFVEKLADSYIAKKMPGKAIDTKDGGFTRRAADKTGSEFYKLPLLNGVLTRFTATGYAKLAVHEALHNMTGLGNAELHAKGSLAASPPQSQITSEIRQLVQNSLGKIPAQLL